MDYITLRTALSKNDSPMAFVLMIAGDGQMGFGQHQSISETTHNQLLNVFTNLYGPAEISVYKVQNTVFVSRLFLGRFHSCTRN